jgi:hypothetical protein
MRRDLALGATVATALALAPSITAVVGAEGAAQGQGTAPTVFTMTAGEEKEICAGVKAAVTPDPAKLGTLRLDGDPKTGAPVRVFYKASDTAAAASESVLCTVGQAKSPIRIDITPKAASGSTHNQNKDTTDSGTRNPLSGFSNETYPEAFKALFLLFVLAAVLESALAILFNWRPFVETFNARAVRPVVSLAFALVFVYIFGLDLVTALAKLIRPDVPKLDGTGQILTAMVIAGGSAAVNNLMVGLGFRQVRTPETVVAKPPADKGWISVSIVRTAAITGPVTVAIGVAAAGQVPVVASLEKSTRPGYRYFFRDPGRFPGSGGYPVKKGDNVTVKVSARRSDGTSSVLEKTWGANLIADGAIIDLTFRMED